MKRKPRQVAEPARPYAAPKPAKAGRAAEPGGPRFASPEQIRAANAKLLRAHRDVLQKLAQ